MTWTSCSELLELRKKRQYKVFRVSQNFAGYDPNGAIDISQEIEKRKVYQKFHKKEA
tara:strand:- start:945 stop:1115 length:171 start_codon:yes stop_codon:yes gene_type:complete